MPAATPRVPVSLGLATAASILVMVVLGRIVMMVMPVTSAAAAIVIMVMMIPVIMAPAAAAAGVTVRLVTFGHGLGVAALAAATSRGAGAPFSGLSQLGVNLYEKFNPLKADLFADELDKMRRALVRLRRADDLQPERLVAELGEMLVHLAIEREGKIGVDLFLKLKELKVAAIPRAGLRHTKDNGFAGRVLSDEVNDVGILKWHGGVGKKFIRACG